MNIIKAIIRFFVNLFSMFKKKDKPNNGIVLFFKGKLTCKHRYRTVSKRLGEYKCRKCGYHVTSMSEPMFREPA